MTNLAERIPLQQVAPGQLAIYWLAQAGFAFKNASGKIVYIDPYFSEVVERMFGFKRMMACPIRVEDVTADLVVCTHEHLDHLDTDALPVLGKKTQAHFAGPVECMKAFAEAGIPAGRCHLLECGQTTCIEGVGVTGVYADHGEYAPDALGVVLDFDGIRVYHTGDTAYRPEEFAPAIQMKPHVLLPCINGAYGNLNAEEAARLTQAVAPKLSIASHFWMFVAHGGEPAAFLDACTRLAPDTQALVMKPGEMCLFQLQ